MEFPYLLHLQIFTHNNYFPQEPVKIYNVPIIHLKD